METLSQGAESLRFLLVDEADFTNAREVCGVDVFLDDRSDVAWGEGVEVECGLDRDPVGHVAV